MVKLSRGSWLFLVSGVVVIVLISMGLIYRNQVGEKANLNQQLSTIQQEISGISKDGLDNKQIALNNQLEQDNSSLIIAKLALSPPINCTDIEDSLFGIARSANVDINSINASGIGMENLQGIDCAVIPMTIEVKGNVQDINKFIQNTTAKYPTCLIKSIDINIPAISNDTNASNVTTGIIALNIYSDEGK